MAMVMEIIIPGLPNRHPAPDTNLPPAVHTDPAAQTLQATTKVDTEVILENHVPKLSHTLLKPPSRPSPPPGMVFLCKQEPPFEANLLPLKAMVFPQAPKKRT